MLHDTGERGGGRTRVLLVDDDEDILESWRLLLGDRFDVETASDGQEALARVEAERFDVIVLDLMMPVMDGAAFKRAADARGITTPVLIVSAGSDIVAQGRALGARAVLAKPVDPAHLEGTIAELAAGPSGGGSPQRGPGSRSSGGGGGRPGRQANAA
jgi:CheY-like chemotaxis protein